MFYMTSGMEREKRDEFKPYPWKRQIYYRQGTVDQLTSMIYNDAPIEKIVKASETRMIKVKQVNEEVANKLMIEGEKWCQLNEPVQSLVFTSYGRIINTHTVKQLKLGMSNHNIFWFANGAHINLRQLFESIGWEFDIDTIYGHYVNNEWRHNDFRKDIPESMQRPHRASKRNSIDIHPSMKKKFSIETQSET